MKARTFITTAALAAAALLGAACEPGAKMWERAADAVKPGYRQGDLVIIVPEWQDGRIHHFQKRGMEAVAVADAAAADWKSRERVWLVHEGGEPRGVAVLKRSFGADQKTDVPFLTIHLFDRKRTADDVAYDFVRKVRDAQVVFLGAEGKSECQEWRDTGTGPRCSWGKESWEYVGETTERFGGDVQSCVWAHPEERGTVSITYPAVPRAGVVEGNYGIADTGVDNTAGKDVTLEVLVGGERKGSFVLRAGQSGWKRWTAPAALGDAAASGETVPVEFRVSTNGQHGRHFCFDAVVRKPGGGAAAGAGSEVRPSGDIPGEPGGDDEQTKKPKDDSFGSGN